MSFHFRQKLLRLWYKESPYIHCLLAIQVPAASKQLRRRHIFPANAPTPVPVEKKSGRYKIQNLVKVEFVSLAGGPDWLLVQNER